MIKLAICDDEQYTVNEIASSIDVLLSAHKELEYTVSKFCKSLDLLEAHRKTPFDVVFLDIDMPDMSGFDLAKEIRKQGGQVYIIFVSAKRDLVFDSFEYNPFYFICKSDAETLKSDLTHVIDKLTVLMGNSKIITVKDTTSGDLLVPVQNIIYVKSERHYLYYYLRDHSKPYIERAKIKDRETELLSADFIRPHLRYLVNMHCIKQYRTTSGLIISDNDNVIPISKTYEDASLNAYMVFKRRYI